MVVQLIIASALLFAPVKTLFAGDDCGSCCSQPLAKCCCISDQPVNSDSEPLNAAPVASAPTAPDWSLHLHLVWTLPELQPAVSVAAFASQVSLPAVPLFQRNCVILC